MDYGYTRHPLCFPSILKSGNSERNKFANRYITDGGKCCKYVYRPIYLPESTPCNIFQYCSHQVVAVTKYGLTANYHCGGALQTKNTTSSSSDIGQWCNPNLCKWEQFLGIFKHSNSLYLLITVFTIQEKFHYHILDWVSEGQLSLKCVCFLSLRASCLHKHCPRNRFGFSQKIYTPQWNEPVRCNREYEIDGEGC